MNHGRGAYCRLRDRVAVDVAGVHTASRRLCVDCPRPDHPLVVSLLGGGVWPLVLLGLIEVGALAATEKAAADSSPQLSVLT
jgi:hypothetical protein